MRQNILYFISAACLLVTGCSQNNDIKFNTDYFSVGINNKGYITSMKNITVSPAKEFSPTDAPSPVISLYNSKLKKYSYPNNAKYNSNKN